MSEFKKIYEIGDHIFIGDNSYITEGDETFNHKKSIYHHIDLVGQEAIVMSEPIEGIDDDPILYMSRGYISPISRIKVKLVSNGKEYMINNDCYHSKSLAAVNAFVAEMDLLADALAKESADMIGYSDEY